MCQCVSRRKKKGGNRVKLDKEKMKILRKINKGLILTIIVILALAVYLVKIEEQRKVEKEEIKKVCEEFIEFTDKHLILPEDMQKIGKVEKGKEEEYQKEIKSELEKRMIKNEEAVNIQYKFLVNNLKEGYNEQEIRTKYNREIIKILSYEFDKEQVIVRFNAKVDISLKYLNEEGKEQVNESSFSTTGDEITLQKIEGKWKVGYSNLQYSEYGKYVEDTMMMY